MIYLATVFVGLADGKMDLSFQVRTRRHEREREKKNQAAATTHHDSGVAKSRASIKVKRM